MRELSIATAVLSAVSFVIYLSFYDILIPGLPEGSYRLAIGSMFAIPALLLALGQVGIGGAIITFAVSSIRKERLSKENYLKSLFVASLITLLFAFTYVIYPFYGPFYYIVFSAGGLSPVIIAGEIAWTAIMVVAGTLLISRMNKLRTSHALLVTVIAIIFITVAAS
ncbi:MAG: hypothetical protein QT00_C0002G0031 [archaeon GW2011_AR5]|nr:MAG: hypothetical protein QT00_C0002G0031 [archaeon GW2011_AR5]